MQNRIKYLRSVAGLTQAQLADALGTTPATVSRLENNQMTVSMDWLSRIADVLQTDASNLVESTTQPAITLLGNAARSGRISRSDQSWYFDPPSKNAVAAKIAQNQGLYREGEVVLGEKLPAESLLSGVGRDCICELEDRSLVIARVAGQAPKFVLIPPAQDAPILYDVAVNWLAPITYRILQVI